MRRNRLLVAAAIAVVLVLAFGVWRVTAGGPRAMTTEQAQALAIVRFNQFNAGKVPTRIEVSGSPSFMVTTLIDYRKGIGYGADTAVSEGTTSKGLVAWSDLVVASAPGDRLSKPPPPKAWSERSLDGTSALHTALLLALRLGVDRPENPELLKQSGARFLRDDSVDGHDVWVIAGPGSSDAVANGPSSSSRTTYWVDHSGHLLKFEARVGSDPEVRVAMYPGDKTGAPASIPASIPGILRVTK